MEMFGFSVFIPVSIILIYEKGKASEGATPVRMGHAGRGPGCLAPKYRFTVTLHPKF